MSQTKLPQDIDMSPFTVYSHYMVKGASNVSELYEPGTNAKAWTDPTCPSILEVCVPFVEGVRQDAKRTIFSNVADEKSKRFVQSIFNYQQQLELSDPFESNRAQEWRHEISKNYSHMNDEFKHIQSVVHKQSDIPEGDVNFTTATDAHVGMDVGEDSITNITNLRIFKFVYHYLNFLQLSKADFLVILTAILLVFLFIYLKQ